MGDRTCMVAGCHKPHLAWGVCNKHYKRSQQGRPLVGLTSHEQTPEQRFWAKVEVGDCWTWTGGLDSDGYGIFSTGGQPKRAHRWLWEQLVGPIRPGLHMDHLCRNRACLNPDHLEPVQCFVNLHRGIGIAPTNAAKTYCAQGHEFSAANTRYTRRQRVCRTCSRQWSRESKARFAAGSARSKPPALAH